MIKIHVNQGLEQQVRYGNALRQGFNACGVESGLTYTPEGDSDIHVVLGPWFALDRWRDHPRVIQLDRCFYRGNPDHVSLAWLKNGHRVFKKGSGREPPEKKPTRIGEKSIFLADYNGRVDHADTVRLHPEKNRYAESLHNALDRHDVAIGYKTTALVDAALMGLRIDCRDKHHILNQPNWLNLLPYADWGIDEIASGEAWKHLRAVE